MKEISVPQVEFLTAPQADYPFVAVVTWREHGQARTHTIQTMSEDSRGKLLAGIIEEISRRRELPPSKRHVLNRREQRFERRMGRLIRSSSSVSDR